jgi:hypothetical protein
MDDATMIRARAAKKLGAVFLTGLALAFIRGTPHVMHEVVVAYTCSSGPHPSTFLAKVRKSL